MTKTQIKNLVKQAREVQFPTPPSNIKRILVLMDINRKKGYEEYVAEASSLKGKFIQTDIYDENKIVLIWKDGMNFNDFRTKILTDIARNDNIVFCVALYFETLVDKEGEKSNAKITAVIKPMVPRPVKKVKDIGFTRQNTVDLTKHFSKI